MAEKEAKPKSKRGRKKERAQISIRIDKVVMDIAYRVIKGTAMRITDLVERGLILAVREIGDLTPLSHHARLILHDEGVEFSRLILNVNIWRRLPEVRELTPLEKLQREHFLAMAAAALELPNAADVLKLMGVPKD